MLFLILSRRVLMHCEICFNFERELRDLECEIEGLIDLSKGADIDATVERMDSCHRLDNALETFCVAHRLYGHHRLNPHDLQFPESIHAR